MMTMIYFKWMNNYDVQHSIVSSRFLSTGCRSLQLIATEFVGPVYCRVVGDMSCSSDDESSV